MFQQPDTDMPDMEVVKKFILAPSQNLTPVDYDVGMRNLLIVLRKNPLAVFEILNSDEYVPAIYLLEDLIDKVVSQKCVEKLDIIFEKVIDHLLAANVFSSLHDIKRIKDKMPVFLDSILEKITANESNMRRLFNCEGCLTTPAEMMAQIEREHPKYAGKFADFYKINCRGSALIVVRK